MKIHIGVDAQNRPSETDLICCSLFLVTHIPGNGDDFLVVGVSILSLKHGNCRRKCQIIAVLVPESPEKGNGGDLENGMVYRCQ